MARRISTNGWILLLVIGLALLMGVIPVYRTYWNIQKVWMENQIRSLEFQTTSKILEETCQKIKENPEYLKVLWIQSLSNSKQVIYVPVDMNGQIILNKVE